MLGVTILIPKPLLPAWAAEPLIMKVNGVVLPNTELLVSLLVIWVVAPEPEVVAEPKEKTAVVLPKAVWVLPGVLKAEAVGSKTPKADCTVLPKAGWAGAGAGVAVGAGAAEFPKMKELPKLGVMAGLVAPCCCPNESWGLVPGYDGSGALVLEPEGMLNAGVAALLNVSLGWLVVTRTEAVRVLPKPPKPVALLLVPVCMALGRDWPKVVTVVEVGIAGGLPDWNVEPMAGVKLVPEAGKVPKRKGLEVEVVVLVTLLMVLVTLLTPKLKAGFKVQSAEVFAVVMEATADVALTWPVKRGVPMVVAGVVV